MAGTKMRRRPDWVSLKDYISYGTDGQKPDISLCEYSLLKLTPDLLVAVTELFFPEFAIHESGVFLADRFTVSVYDTWNRGKYKNDLAAIERVMNHVHLVETFGNGFREMSKQNIYYIGEAMVQTWKAALLYEFPDRSFMVQGTSDEAGRDADSGDFVITFWETKQSQ